jgi:hypothetical protein
MSPGPALVLLGEKHARPPSPTGARGERRRANWSKRSRVLSRASRTSERSYIVQADADAVGDLDVRGVAASLLRSPALA